MGVAKCRERAAQSVWWPRIGKDIKSRVASCRHCLEKQPSQASEPLLPSALPDRPFQKVGIDICEFRNKHYLVQEDYYSRYIDVTYLPSLTSATVIGLFLPSCPETELFQTTVPSSLRQSSVPLQIGGTSAMSAPAAPTIRKAMVLRSERWRPSKRSSGRTTSSLPFRPNAQPPFPTSELALLSWLWEESSEPPCHHCHRRSTHESLVTRKCESVTQAWSGVRRKTTIVATECSLSRN